MIYHNASKFEWETIVLSLWPIGESQSTMSMMLCVIELSEKAFSFPNRDNVHLLYTFNIISPNIFK